MKNKTKYIIYAIGISIVVALLVWKYTHQPNDDLSTKAASKSYLFSELISKIDKDTSGLLNTIIAVEGPIKKITKDSTSLTYEIGTDATMSSIICDIDSRHIKDFENIQEGNTIGLKGLVTSTNIDPNSVFGNTINLTFCVKK